MNVLLIGSGGREHAMAWGIAKSPKLSTLYVAPGNPGIAEIAKCVDLNSGDSNKVIDFCKQNDVELVVVGPEAPLVDGISDDLEKAGIAVFGPSKEAAQIEGSKEFMKDIVAKYGVPTAEYSSFTDLDSAISYIKEKGAPIVVKTDGLAAGKGVTVAMTEEEAVAAAKEAMEGGKFGDAGKKLVIEEFLEGEEASFFAFCDGKNVVAFGSAQDHKAVGEGDTGPNTGGMGTYSPAPIVDKAMEQKIMNDIILPTVKGLEKDGIPYKGILFAGLMISNNVPELLEFNVRLGDPEAQVLIPRLKSDLLELFLLGSKGGLDKAKVAFSNETALCVVMASKGYPGSYEKGTIIKGLKDADAISNTQIFHAGTSIKDNEMVANGGRVLGVTALGKDALEAQSLAYRAVDKINWPEGFCRRDIGWRAVSRLKKAS